MSYMMSDNGLCVHKQNSDGTRGDVVKCHKTPEEAAAHMAALYANVGDAATKEIDAWVAEWKEYAVRSA